MDESRQQCESQADQRLVHFPDTETYEDVRFISREWNSLVLEILEHLTKRKRIRPRFSKQQT